MAAPGPIHYGTRGMGFAPETSASKLAVRINPFACKLVFVTASSLFPSRADEGRSLRPETRVHGIVLNQDTQRQHGLRRSTCMRMPTSCRPIPGSFKLVITRPKSKPMSIISVR